MKISHLIVVFFISSLLPLAAQEEVNQMDAQGARHGLWRKYYPGTEQIRYEGTFEHGKEVGVFKFYCEECGNQPTATRTFNTKDKTVWVQYFTINGKLVSEGKLIDREREGEWISYHKNSTQPMSKEYYVRGKQQGKQTTFYPDGTITEEIHFENGIKEGENLYYSPEGVIIKRLQYRNDMLQGPAIYYDAFGNIAVEGFYKDDKKHGLWKYYKNGKLEFEETYPKPINKSEKE
jgi:antitoxin component YwqK of YwqJK toxin-antitoxin module